MLAGGVAARAVSAAGVDGEVMCGVGGCGGAGIGGGSIDIAGTPVAGIRVGMVVLFGVVAGKGVLALVASVRFTALSLLCDTQSCSCQG